MPDPFQIPDIGSSRSREIDPRQLRTHTPRPQEPSASFQEILTDTVGEVQRLQNEADQSIRQLVSGEVKDVTEAMVAIERADISFQSMMAVRNKIVQAYEEVMRMQV
mgnify:FL=1